MIYITGCNGQLGQTIRSLYPNYTFFDSNSLDITNDNKVKEVLRGLSAGVIINCAAYTAVDDAEDEQEKAYLVNRDGVRNLAKYSSEYGHKLIHVSTDYVFDGSSTTPYKENDNISPLGIYGKSKLEGEMVIAEYLNDFAIVRTSWVYSPFGKNFLKTMLKLSNKNELNVVHDQVGSPTYTGDLAKVLINLSERPEILKGETYHYSNEGEVSWSDFASEIMKTIGSKCKIHPIESSQYPTRVKRPSYSVLNKSKIKKALDIDIPHWKESLSICLSKMEK